MMQMSTLRAAIRRAAIPVSMLAIGCSIANAAHEIVKKDDNAPPIHPASDEGQQAIGHIKIPEGLKIELWAAEPMLANPVCMRVDNRDRVYLVETFRHTS